jgi:hypothetical protein
MQTSNGCFETAMFIASESYSGSAYEAALFHAMDEDCDEAIVIVLESDAATAPAMAV